MLRSKKTAYVTIGDASALPAAPDAEGADALACADGVCEASYVLNHLNRLFLFV